MTTTDAGAIRLHRAAPWNDQLRNPYRTRYAQTAGRYFLVEADSLDAPWFVWEIDADGRLLGGPDAAFVAIAYNLPAVRAAVGMLVAGETVDTIRDYTSRATRAGTGRNHPTNVAQRRNWTPT